MGTVRYLNIAKSKRNEDTLASLRMNYKQYNSKAKIGADELERRFAICAKCSNCLGGVACERIGSCGSGKNDFFTMHLNRNNGGCPVGQW